MHLTLAAVMASASKPRRGLDKEPFAELKRSIFENGLLQPVVVRVAGELYEIVGGHRRYAALCELAREHPGDPRFARSMWTTLRST
jgi:ParB family chromosome partitioning protein